MYFWLLLQIYRVLQGHIWIIMWLGLELWCWKYSFDHRNKLQSNTYSHRKHPFYILIIFSNFSGVFDQKMQQPCWAQETLLWSRSLTPIFSSISCLAISICWGDPRMERSARLGRCSEEDFSAAPHGLRTAGWCSLWSLPPEQNTSTWTPRALFHTE